MSSKFGDDLHAYYGNRWLLEFSKRGVLHDDETLIENRKKAGANVDDFDIFLRDGNVASCEVDVTEAFCRGTNFQDVSSGNGKAGYRRAIWFDDRVRSSSPGLDKSGQARQHNNPLTATAFSRNMEEPWSNHRDLRRIIYINNLDAACIHALAATVSCHQAMVLRNAIYKHLAFQTSIAVKFRSAGFRNFQLDLHIPFFLWRKSAPPGEHERKINTKPLRRWKDLSFLKSVTPESQGQEPEEVWSILEAQISCVITGSDDGRWTAYGFVDDEIDGLLTDSETDLKCDQIAGGDELVANTPIWAPRDYWLKVFELRIEQVRKLWETLIYEVERGGEKYMNEHPSTLSQRSGTAKEQNVETKAAFDWTLKMKDLIRKLDGPLSSTIEAWKSFNSSNGDMGCFRDITSSHAIISIYCIHKTFQELQEYQKRLAGLKGSCSDYSNALELSLTLESKDAADKNGVTAEFMVSILYPIALAAAIFSMQKGVIPLEPNPRSFVLTSFLLIVMTYVARNLILPSLQKIIALWTKIKPIGESGDKISGKTSAGIFPPIRRATSATIISDDERNAP